MIDSVDGSCTITFFTYTTRKDDDTFLGEEIKKMKGESKPF